MKKTTALLLVLILALSVVGVSAHTSARFKNGDVNRDGATKIQDANLIQQSLVGMKTLDWQQNQLADYDLNGNVNILDVTEIQLILVNAKSSPEEAPIVPEKEVPPVSNTQVSDTVRVYFSNNKNWSNVYFYVYDSSTEVPKKDWPGDKITTYTPNDSGENVFYADVDTSKYDRIIFTDGTNQTVNTALCKASSGFFISNDSNKSAMMVGTYAYTGADKGNLTELNFDYPGGYKKKVWIWTPADYNPEGEKYRTIYLTDGQNLFDSYPNGRKPPYGGWEVTDAVESMMSNGGRGVIIVGIENKTYRDNELTPNIGELNPELSAADARSFKDGNGAQFGDFVVNYVMPYVQGNYNSSRATADNMICGSSSGGIESFYIGMEYNDKFGMIGALSPAFLLFDDSVWNSYLSKFDLDSDDMPKLYLFNGNHKDDSLERNLKVYCDEMYNRLNNAGYKNMTYVIEDDFMHNEAYWRVIFPDCISYLLGI